MCMISNKMVSKFFKFFFSFVFTVYIVNDIILLISFDKIVGNTIWGTKILEKNTVFFITIFLIIIELLLIMVIWDFFSLSKISDLVSLFLLIDFAFIFLLLLRFDNVNCSKGFITNQPELVALEKLILFLLFFFRRKIFEYQKPHLE